MRGASAEIDLPPLSLLLDTTVLIDALRGRPVADRIQTLRRSGPPPWVCAVNIEEVWRGAFPAEYPDVERFLAGFRIAPLGGEEGRQAGSWRSNHAARGITLSQADCLVAAAALGIGVRLATGNPSHFPMPELGVEHWPVNA